MAIADRERELIGIRTRQALQARRARVGEWRASGPNEKKAAASIRGVEANKEMAASNENNRRASSMIDMLRRSGKTYTGIADQLNRTGFRTSRGCEFQATQVKRLYERAAVDS